MSVLLTALCAYIMRNYEGIWKMTRIDFAQKGSESSQSQTNSKR